jgi:DNA-binding FadR family transcriptional regulator
MEMIREFEPPRSSRARDVADHLAAIIAEHEPGDRLGTKEELRQRLSVAMGTMNEAVRLLQERGLITVKSGPKGGLFAASPDPLVNLGQIIIAIRGEPTTVRSAEVIRNALEPLIVLAALRNRRRTDITDLRRILRAMSASVDDPHAFLIRNWELHERIAEASDDRLLTSVYLLVNGVLREQLKSIEPTPLLPQMSRERLDIHVRLIESIVARDEQAARRAVDEHAQDLSVPHG